MLLLLPFHVSAAKQGSHHLPVPVKPFSGLRSKRWEAMGAARPYGHYVRLEERWDDTVCGYFCQLKQAKGMLQLAKWQLKQAKGMLKWAFCTLQLLSNRDKHAEGVTSTGTPRPNLNGIIESEST